MKLNNTSKELKGSYECAKHVLYYLYIRQSFLLVGNFPFHLKLIAFDSWLLLLDVELQILSKFPLRKLDEWSFLKMFIVSLNVLGRLFFFLNLGVFLSL